MRPFYTVLSVAVLLFACLLINAADDALKGAPGCSHGERWGNGLADNPCRNTYSWDHDMSKVKARYP